MYLIYFEENPPTESPETVDGGTPQSEETAETVEGEEVGENDSNEVEREEENTIIYESVDYTEHFETLETIAIANCLAVSFLALIIILWKVFRTS